jgi:hypothetical protein
LGFGHFFSNTASSRSHVSFSPAFHSPTIRRPALPGAGPSRIGTTSPPSHCTSTLPTRCKAICAPSRGRSFHGIDPRILGGHFVLGRAGSGGRRSPRRSLGMVRFRCKNAGRSVGRRAGESRAAGIGLKASRSLGCWGRMCPSCPRLTWSFEVCMPTAKCLVSGRQTLYTNQARISLRVRCRAARSNCEFCLARAASAASWAKPLDCSQLPRAHRSFLGLVCSDSLGWLC